MNHLDFLYSGWNVLIAERVQRLDSRLPGQLAVTSLIFDQIVYFFHLKQNRKPQHEDRLDFILFGDVSYEIDIFIVPDASISRRNVPTCELQGERSDLPQTFIYFFLHGR